MNSYVCAILGLVTLSGSVAEQKNELGKVTINPFNESLGVVFLPQGDVVFTETSWQLVISLNISSVEADFERLGEALKRIRDEAGHSIDNHMAEKLGTQYQEIRDHLDRLNEEIRDPSSMRQTRSLNPFDWISGSIGSIARRLFGIASEEEVKQLTSYVSILYKKEEKIATMQSLHITAMKLMEGQVVQQQNQLSVLTNVTKLLLDTVAPPKAKRTNLSSNILVVYGEMENAISAFRRMIESLSRTIKALDVGLLTRSLLPESELQGALRHIRDQLPYDSYFVFDIDNDEIHRYYHNQLIIRLSGEKSIRAVLRIPLRMKSDMYRLYQAVPFPRTLQVGKKMERTRIKETESKVAISKDGKNFFSLKNWLPQLECLRGPPKVCPIHSALVESPQESCYFAILATQKIAPTKCEYEIMKKEEISLEKLNEVTWIVSTGMDLTVESRCINLSSPTSPMKGKTYGSINGEYLIRVPRQCSVRIGPYQIPLRLRITSGLELQEKEDVILPEAGEETNPELLTMTTSDRYEAAFQEAYRQLAQLQVNGTDVHPQEEIEKIFKQMITVKDELDHIKPLWVSHYTSFGVGGLWFILAITVFVIWWKCIRPNSRDCRGPIGTEGNYPVGSVVFRTVAPEAVEMITGPATRRDPIYE